MNIDKIEKESEIPLFMRIVLIAIAAALCIPVLLTGLSVEKFISFLFLLIKNLVFLPGIFVIAGWLLKLRDDTFKLSNAYYLGVLMAIVLLVQSLKAQ